MKTPKLNTDSSDLTCDWVEVLADEFEDAWLKGRSPSIDEFLSRGTPDDHGRLLAELVCIDAHHRRKTGSATPLSDYQQRYPELMNLDAEAKAILERFTDVSTVSPGKAVTHIPASPESGGHIGRYQVVEELGKGGQARVYRVFDPVTGRVMVLKIANQQWTEGSAARNRLLDEARALYTLDHPNLVRVRHFDFHETRPYFVMDDVRGRTLNQIAAQQIVTQEQAALWIAGAARAVAYANSHNVFHRDLKPQNILIDDAGQPRVIDFGLAFQVDPWDRSSENQFGEGGTLRFMAPEQFTGPTVATGPRTDVFGLGGTLFYLLTKKPPIAGNSDSDVLSKVGRGAVSFERLDQPHIKPKLAAICRKALQADPMARYANATEMADELERSVRPRPVFPYVAAALFLLMLGVGYFIVPRTPPVVKPLTVKVLRSGSYESLTDVLPLQDTDAIQVRWRVPARMFASLFVLTSDGKWERVANYDAESSDHDIVYPDSQSARRVKDAGPHLIIACARASGPVETDEIRQLWGATANLAPMPERSIKRITPQGIELGGEQSRSLGDIVTQADPLQEFQLKLTEHIKFFSGVAFTRP